MDPTLSIGDVAGDVADSVGTGTIILGSVALAWLLLSGRDRAQQKLGRYRSRKKKIAAAKQSLKTAQAGSWF
jgi:hypothetical protein